jgi:hypothetical protein
MGTSGRSKGREGVREIVYIYIFANFVGPESFIGRIGFECSSAEAVNMTRFEIMRKARLSVKN